MPSYLLACFVLGLGIGLDVILATLSRVKYITPIRGWLWVKRITTTHIAFPMIGYYGFIELFYLFPALRVLLGLVAFALIIYFLIDVIKGWLNTSTQNDNDNPFSWSVVLSVSWDALFSGPAKSAQAINWNHNQVIFSFFISGLVVTLLTIFAVRLTYFLRKAAANMLKTSVKKYVKYQIALMLSEFIIFLYFGLLALARYTFSSDIPPWLVGLISLALGVVLYLSIHKSLLPVVTKQITKELLDSSSA